MKDSMVWRTRWAALGAAVAVSLGGGGLFLANAAPTPDESTIVNVTPTRVLDTRDPVNLGLAGPFTSPTSQKLQITGSVPVATGGSAIVVPVGATGVLLNVTAVSPTAPGFISIRPGSATGAPTTSSLNVETGSNIPNAVQVALPTSGADAGKIDITYDAYGVAGRTTELLVDIVGYTKNTGLQELVADVGTKANINQLPIARSARVNDITPEPATPAVLTSVTMTVPVAGIIQLNGSTYVFSSGTGGTFRCHLTVGAGNTSNSGDLADTDRAVTLAASEPGSCATNGSLPVAAGTYVVNIVGDTPGTGDLDDTTLEATFIAGGTVTASDAAAVSDESEK